MLAKKQDECIPISPARTLSGTTEHGVLSLLAGLGLKGIVLRGSGPTKLTDSIRLYWRTGIQIGFQIEIQ